MLSLPRSTALEAMCMRDDMSSITCYREFGRAVRQDSLREYRIVRDQSAGNVGHCNRLPDPNNSGMVRGGTDIE